MNYGYIGGGSDIRRLPVANTAAVALGDMLKIDGAGSPYVTPAGAGDLVVGVALEACTIPTLDGDRYIMCECSPTAHFEYLTDASGSIADTLMFKTCDISGAQEIDIGASTNDIIIIIGVDTDRLTVIVTIDFSKALTGVV